MVQSKLCCFCNSKWLPPQTVHGMKPDNVTNLDPGLRDVIFPKLITIKIREWEPVVGHH